VTGTIPVLARLIPIDTEIDRLRKILRAIKGAGEEVPRGRCAALLLKVAPGEALALPPHSDEAKAYEDLECKKLERFWLKQACKCGKLGKSFSEDPSLMDGTFAAYSEVRNLAAKARAKGIKNPLIAKYVGKAEEIKYCFDLATIKSLHDTERAIDAIINATLKPEPGAEEHRPAGERPGVAPPAPTTVTPGTITGVIAPATLANPARASPGTAAIKHPPAAVMLPAEHAAPPRRAGTPSAYKSTITPDAGPGGILLDDGRPATVHEEDMSEDHRKVLELLKRGQ
jgi:hypothetical protein